MLSIVAPLLSDMGELSRADDCVVSIESVTSSSAGCEVKISASQGGVQEFALAGANQDSLAVQGIVFTAPTGTAGFNPSVNLTWSASYITAPVLQFVSRPIAGCEGVFASPEG
jgi:hypothetical protein